MLRPSVEVVAERERQRTATTGKVAYRPGEMTVADLDAAVAETPLIGLWLDTSELSPEETVAEIVSRSDEALVHGDG